MGALLRRLQKNHDLHTFVKAVYGNTIGLYFLKEWYARNVGFYNGKKRIKLVSISFGEELVSRAIKSERPFMLARYGSTEIRTLFDKNHLSSLCFYSGFFPNDKNLYDKFVGEYVKSSKQLDFLAIRGYKNNFFKKIRWLRMFPNLKYFLKSSGGFRSKWIKDLKGKRVLVVNSHKTTIEHQYKKMGKLGILPKLKSLEVIRSVQTIAGETDSRFKDWFEALDYMKRSMDKKSYDILIVGAGAYGLPLAAHAKSRGKQALHLGGGLQLLFGIKGKRWDKDGFYTKDWVKPMKADYPKNYKKIEGGCYW